MYRNQIEECADAGPELLAGAESPFVALHGYFLDRPLPVCGRLLDAAVDAGEVRAGTRPYELMRGIGNLCIGGGDPQYEPRRLIELLLCGLRHSRPE
ncbi:hypothetical protein GCM10023235_71840 [Kitasatospora terrestris]|uniref:TetR family transcriptional regulator n=1 Tax=Kitasatospora terrestris TaxID=258051 RepID=A0ABP9EJU0_9ACTN